MATAPRRKAVATAPKEDVTEIQKEVTAITPERVTVIVPKDYTLVLDDHSPVKYSRGTQEMPVDHLNHWWSAANGVTKYEPK